MTNPRGHCISCNKELTAIDDDPNGAFNSTCRRCEAEEAHDFDAEPDAVFSDLGERLDEPKRPCSTYDPLQQIFDAAEQHSDDSGEMDMQVGDLEDVIRAAWRIMSPEQRQQLLNSEEVTDLLAPTEQDEDE